MSPFECAVSATRGDRSYQEDAALFWPGAATFTPEVAPADAPEGALLAILADGMGGHAGGAIASQLVCETFLAGISGAIDLEAWRQSGPETTVPLDGDGNAEREHDTSAEDEPTGDLLAALHAANAEIGKKADANPALNGMGTTLVGVMFTVNETASRLDWVSVGDSPLYLYRDGEIALLNEDHSLAPALDLLAAEGTISEEAARNDPRRHMLRSAVTGEELDMIDVSRQPLLLQEGDVVILASDGIHTLSEGEIARIVTAYTDDGPEGIAHALVRSIENQRMPHQDNATIMVIRQKSSAKD